MIRLLRYVCVFVLIILGAYQLIRGPSPMWTIGDRGRTFVLKFAPDSKTFWTYTRLDQTTDHEQIRFEQIDIARGQVVKDFRIQLQYAMFVTGPEISDDGSAALIQRDTDTRVLFLVNMQTGAVQTLDFGRPKVELFSISPRGSFLIQHKVPLQRPGDVHIWTIMDRQRNTILKLTDEKDAHGQQWSPESYLFHPDEKHLVVTWYPTIDMPSDCDPELRFYDVDSRKELMRMKFPVDGGYCVPVQWYHDNLMVDTVFLQHDPIGRLIDTYSMKVTFNPDQIQKRFLIHHGNCQNDRTSSMGVVEKYASGSYVIQQHLPRKDNWIIQKLKDRPSLSKLIDKVWPKFVTEIEIRRMADQQVLKHISFPDQTAFTISPDGNWIIPELDASQIALYSTDPVLRWPGYLCFVFAFLILLGRYLVHLPSKSRKLTQIT